MLSSLPQLRFSSHHGEFAVNTFGQDKVLPCAHGSIVSSGTVKLNNVGMAIILKPLSLSHKNYVQFQFTGIGIGKILCISS